MGVTLSGLTLGAPDPDGQNDRDLTDESISMHPGIMPGTGDLGQEFAWHDAVVKITVQRVA